jgi:hypothetical protein
MLHLQRSNNITHQRNQNPLCNPLVSCYASNTTSKACDVATPPINPLIVPGNILFMKSSLACTLYALRELFQPIDEHLRMSEGGKSHLGHVLDRWADIC